MAKKKSKLRPAPQVSSKDELKAREEERRIRRELALQRRIASLSRQLSHATAHGELRLFQLGRAIVTERGWTVAKSDYVRELVDDNARLNEELTEAAITNGQLRTRIDELERAGV